MGDIRPDKQAGHDVAIVDIPAGKYTLSIAVVDEASSPVIKLAIKGRAEDGW